MEAWPPSLIMQRVGMVTIDATDRTAAKSLWRQSNDFMKDLAWASIAARRSWFVQEFWFKGWTMMNDIKQVLRLNF